MKYDFQDVFYRTLVASPDIYMVSGEEEVLQLFDEMSKRALDSGTTPAAIQDARAKLDFVALLSSGACARLENYKAVLGVEAHGLCDISQDLAYLRRSVKALPCLLRGSSIWDLDRERPLTKQETWLAQGFHFPKAGVEIDCLSFDDQEIQQLRCRETSALLGNSMHVVAVGVWILHVLTSRSSSPCEADR